MRSLRCTLLLLFAAACAARAQPPVRAFAQVIRSNALPRIEIEVDPSLSYLGTVSLPAMGGRAQFDQYIFSEVRDGRMGRTLIVHFEHVLPGNDLVFDYPRLSMVTLGRHEYLHQSWPVENWDLFGSPAMGQLLGNRSIQAPTTWLVNRYVRAVDLERKAELILFYLEPSGPLPAAIAELGLGGNRRDLWEPIAAGLADRARAAFTVRD